MLRYIKTFISRYQFPTECGDALTSSYNILENKGMIQKLRETVGLYKTDSEPSYEELAGRVAELAEMSGVCYYTLWLIVMILMTEVLHQRYENLSYPEYVYDYSVIDLKYKAVECRLVKGVWGSFVSAWEYLIFQMKIFGFSALQFEPIAAERDYLLNGVMIKKGETMLSIHIPRREKHLDENEVTENFKQAADFFSGRVKFKAFYCESWLLFPKNKEILSPDSHLRHFIDRFTLVSVTESPDYSEMWRLFDAEIDENNLDSLPTDTSFRRKYVELMKNGEKTGGGIGIYVPETL